LIPTNAATTSTSGGETTSAACARGARRSHGRRGSAGSEAEGYVASFSFSGQRTRYRYLRVDDFLYWTSRSPWTPGQNLNRRPVASVAGDPEHEQTALPL
jgi:hypothetical protein